MKHIESIENVDNLRALVRQDLRELGVKLPKAKKKRQSISKNQEDGKNGAIFGNYLSLVPHVYVEECGYVPKFLVDASEVIHQNIEQEGLFRKSGAVSRQKQLKQQVELGKGMKDANVCDVTSLVKQFFRKLPEPLFTSIYHDAFIRCFQIGQSDQSRQATLLQCLLLPGEHLSTLRFFMLLLAEIVRHSEQNKMDAGNLAVVLAPNLMHINSKSEKMNSSEEKLLQVQTSIVELLITNASYVGMVSQQLCEKASLMTDVWGTDDELDASCDALEESHNVKKEKKRRKRSGSFQGILSTIANSVSKWRRSTDGKSANLSQASSNMSSVSHYSNMSQMSNKHDQSSMVQNVTQQSMDIPTAMATPVVIRKRKASGDTHPFSASKKKAILKGLPNQAALANTPYTPASGMKKLDITEMRRTGTLNTPSIAFSKNDKLDFSATPSTVKNSRKRLGLFSPANQRKGRKLSSSSLSISCAGKKSTKNKGLFRRFSGGKSDKPLIESAKPPVPEQTTSVGERLASPTNQAQVLDSTSSNQDQDQKSPVAALLNRSVSSPPAVEQSMMSVCGVEQSILSVCEDKNSLNEGFIMPEDLDDELQDMNVTIASEAENGDNESELSDNLAVSSQCKSDTALNMTRNNSDSSLDSIRFASISDMSGLQNQNSEVVKRKARLLRRDRPNSLKAGLLSGDPRKVQRLRRSFGLDKSDIGEPIPICVPDIPGIRLSTVDSENSESCPSQESSDEAIESESRHSAHRNETMILVDKVISDPGEIRSEDSKTDKSIEEVRKSTTSLTNQHPKFQSSDSTDSLLSGQMSLNVSPENQRNTMSRSLSTDSGKGSMFDESGVVESVGEVSNNENLEDFSFMDGKLAMEMIEKEMNPDDKTANTDEMMKQEIRKSISTKELPGTRSRRSSVCRSQSMCVTNVKKQPNFTPDLQISMETHNLLSRAGYFKSTKNTAKDDVQVMGPPVPKIKHAEFHKPKRESILALKVNNAGRVRANVKQFEHFAENNQGKNMDADVIERHSSPFRFPNSVSRKGGYASPLRKNDLSRINESSESELKTKLGKGQARLPISTNLLKPTEKVTLDDEVTETDNSGKQVKRKPSIYFAKDEPRPRRIVKKDLNESNLLNDTADTSIAEVSMDIERSHSSVFDSTEKENKVEECYVSPLPQDDFCTPVKTTIGENEELASSDIANKTLTPKVPKILQPLCDTLILQSPIKTTPQNMLRRSNTTISPKSPIKVVKRLRSPGSPHQKLGRRHSMSPRRYNASVPMSIPQHLQEELNGV